MLTGTEADSSAAAKAGLPGLTANALRVLQARYLKKDEQGRFVETPQQLFERVAHTVADIELLYGNDRAQRDHWQEIFYDLVTSGAFMPNSPTLMNAGREMGMLSACFVLPVKDSVEDIFDAIKYTAMIQKAGGGTGFAFDELRPTGDYIRSSGGTTSGPISFWRAFSEATNAIQQGAFRRGANMGMMYIHHPDILKFLHAKQDLSAFTNYNISVKVTDAWMQEFAERADSPHIVVNPRTGKQYYLPKDLDIWTYTIRSLVPVAKAGDAPPVDVYSKSDIWAIIVGNAWQTGEPGLAFIDRINEDNPTPHIGRIEATNPCGEQPLLPYEACNLGSVNLGMFVTNPATGQAAIDWDRLRSTVHHAVRFLDNIIDANRYPLPQIEQMCKANRKIGLGLMGFADALYKLNVPYNSEEALEWAGRLMKFVNDEAHICSEKLAGERGCFPNWHGSRWQTEHGRPMRNAATTTVAPTGTISIIANCSGGIEPLFSLVFYRNVLKGQDRSSKPMIEVNETFSHVAKCEGFYSEGLMDQIARDGTLAHIEDIPEHVRRVFVCAHDIEPEWHVRMQAAFQHHCDASISKTINFANSATAEEVDAIYRRAFELRCKGITVYRDGCREAQPMALKGKEPEVSDTQQEAPPPEDVVLEPRELPEIVSGLRIRQMTPFGNMHVKITVDPRSARELEVFAQLGKGGDVATSDLEAICRMVSLWLRAGGTLKHVVQQLKDIGSSLQVPTRDGKIMSLGDGLARALMKYQRAKEHFGLKDLLLGDVDLAELDEALHSGNGNGNGHGRGGNGHGQGKAAEAPAIEPDHTAWRLGFKLKCPECSGALVFEEGCVKCYDCGYAQC